MMQTIRRAKDPDRASVVSRASRRGGVVLATVFHEMMMSTWWWVWIAFMFMFLVPPLGYGWGYRGWGAPYPRYIQRRRGEAATMTMGSGGSGQFDHHAWGRGGDFVWMILLIGMFWALAGLWWR